MLCDVKTSHVLRVMPYLGKADHPDDVGVAEYVKLTQTDPYHKTGLNVTTDNIFTFITTAKKFLKHDITTAGTLRSNKKKYQGNCCMNHPSYLFISLDFVLVKMIEK